MGKFKDNEEVYHIHEKRMLVVVYVPLGLTNNPIDYRLMEYKKGLNYKHYTGFVSDYKPVDAKFLISIAEYRKLKIENLL